MKPNRRLAALLLVIGVLLLLAAMFLPGYIFPIRDELAWRKHTDPYQYLNEHPYGLYELSALAEIDELQRTAGFMSRLVSSRYGPEYLTGSQSLSAAFSPDGTEIVTGSGTQAIRWNSASGSWLAAYGPHSRTAASDPRKWGFGLSEVAWVHGTGNFVGMTSGPHSLWFFPETAAAPIPLEGSGFRNLTSRGSRLAWIDRSQHGRVLDLATGQVTKLPHPDVDAMVLLSTDGSVTASIKEVKWWRRGNLEKTVPIDAAYSYLTLSDDGRHLMVLAQTNVEVWSTETGQKRVFHHQHEASASCGSNDTIIIGTDDGMVHFWSAKNGANLRTLRASHGRIDMLVCTPTRLLTFSRSRTEARVWDITGRTHAGPQLRPAAPRIDWLTRMGADYNLPERLPQLASWMESAAHSPLIWWALGALVLLVFVAWAIATAFGRR